jgi:exosortase
MPARAVPVGAKNRSQTELVLSVSLLGACLLWLYWPDLVEISGRWASDAKYSHGYLVPLFAAYLAWSRWRKSPPVTVSPSLWGLSLVGSGLALRLAGSYFYYPWLNEISLLPLLMGLTALLAGWSALRRIAVAITYLFFMIPLPARLELAVSQPLQRIGTRASVYAIQTVGLAAHAEGNVIVLRQIRIGVVEACNGLGMLMIFFALSTVLALLVRRPWTDKAVIVVSAIPIAIICNVARITVTAILYVTAGDKWADLVFHDLAGWLMMPLALGLLWLELKGLEWLFPTRVEGRRSEVYGQRVKNGTSAGKNGNNLDAALTRSGGKRPATRQTAQTGR